MKRPSGEAPILKVYPEQANSKTSKEFTAVLQTIRSPDVRQQIIETLRDFGAMALVITPQLDPMLQQDTGDTLKFLVLMKKTPVDALNLIQLGTALENIVHFSGYIAAVTRESIQELGREFRITKVKNNPLHQIFSEIDKTATGGCHPGKHRAL